jgi:hypothetical protein
MQTRIYVVKCTLDGHTSPRLVEAGTASQAIRHVVGDKFSAEAAGPKDIVDLMTKGVTVEKANTSERPVEATP